MGFVAACSPKLLKSRRREVWCLFLTRPNRTYVRTIWNGKPQMPRVWRCGFLLRSKPNRADCQRTGRVLEMMEDEYHAYEQAAR
jgi:hypothetical protein